MIIKYNEFNDDEGNSYRLSRNSHGRMEEINNKSAASHTVHYLLSSLTTKGSI
jgi:hypothetical protein